MVLLILIILAIIAFWFLCSALYKPLGSFFGGIIKEAKEAMNDDNKEKENENEQR